MRLIRKDEMRLMRLIRLQPADLIMALLMSLKSDELEVLMIIRLHGPAGQPFELVSC